MADEISDQLYKRLTLINQYRILAALYPDDAGMYRDAEKTVSRGWPVIDLPDVEGVENAIENGISQSEATFVDDILDLYGYLQQAEKLGTFERGEFGSLAFPGFDGNGETRFLGFYREVIRRGEKFTYVLKANDPNSHLPMIDRYEAMLQRWDDMDRPHVISRDQAAKILDR